MLLALDLDKVTFLDIKDATSPNTWRTVPVGLVVIDTLGKVCVSNVRL